MSDKTMHDQDERLKQAADEERGRLAKVQGICSMVVFTILIVTYVCYVGSFVKSDIPPEKAMSFAFGPVKAYSEYKKEVQAPGLLEGLKGFRGDALMLGALALLASIAFFSVGSILPIFRKYRQPVLVGIALATLAILAVAASGVFV